MRLRQIIWILWPSFLVAGIAEGLLFTVIHPDDILLFGEPIALSNEGVYTLGFFIIWFFCATSSALSFFVLPRKEGSTKTGLDEPDLI
jgi:hypothetical protein